MEDNRSDSDDEDLEALRLAALATLKPRAANLPKSESPEGIVRNAPNPVIQTALFPRKEAGPSSLPPNQYSWRNNANQSWRGRGRGGFPVRNVKLLSNCLNNVNKKVNQRSSNLIVITPVTEENDFAKKRETSAAPQLLLPQHKWCKADNDNSSSPKTLKRGPTRFNRHDSGSESSDSDYEDNNSDQDSYSNETILQDENSLTFQDESIDRESTPVTDEIDTNHRLNFQNASIDSVSNLTYNPDAIQREPMKYSSYQYRSQHDPFSGTSAFQTEAVGPVNGGQDYDGRRLSESNPVEGYSSSSFVNPNLSQSDLRLELKKRMLKLRSESAEAEKSGSTLHKHVRDESRTSEDSRGYSRDQTRRSLSDRDSRERNRSRYRSRSQSPRNSDRHRSHSRDRDHKRTDRNRKRDYSGSPDRRRNSGSTRSPDRNGKRSWSRSPVKTHQRVSASPTKNNKKDHSRSPEKKNKHSCSRSPEKMNKHDYIWSPEKSSKRDCSQSPKKSNNKDRSRSPGHNSGRKYSRTPERSYKHRSSDSLERTNKRYQSRSPERSTKYNHSPDKGKKHESSRSPVKRHKRISPPRSSKAGKSSHSPRKNRKRSSSRSPNRTSKVHRRSRTRSPVRSRKSDSSRSPNRGRRRSPSVERKHKRYSSPRRSPQKTLKSNNSPHRDVKEKLSPQKEQKDRSRSPVHNRWRDSSESSECSERDWKGKKNTSRRWSRSCSANSSNSGSSSDRGRLKSVSSVVKPVLSSVSTVSVVGSKSDCLLDSGYPQKEKDTIEEKPKVLMSLVKSSISINVGENRTNASDLGKRLPVHMRLGNLSRNKLIRMTKDVEAAFVNSSSDENGETGFEGKKKNLRVVAESTTDVTRRRVEKSPSKNESKSRRKKTYR